MSSNKKLQIYTDGACLGNGKKENIGGWSFVVVDGESLIYEECEIELNTTNNRQEITAVLNSLKYCHENDIVDFVIYCDSQYVVTGFMNWMHKWRSNGWVRGKPAALIPNYELWKEMYYLRFKFDKVDLRWVRGHNGNQWNEYADELIEQQILKSYAK